MTEDWNEKNIKKKKPNIFISLVGFTTSVFFKPQISGFQMITIH